MEEKYNNYEVVCQNVLEVLIINMVRRTKANLLIAPAKHVAKECRFVEQSINTHFREDISLELLSEKAFMNKFYLVHAFTQYKGIDADQKTLLGEKYQEIGIVNKGQFAPQDTFYRTTENTNKKFFTDDFDDLTVSKQSNNDNNVVYHLESSTTYMANIEMVGVEEKPGVLVQDITVNSDAQIVSQVVMILDKETNKQPDNIYKTEYTYSQYNEDVSIDEESIHQSITSIQGKKSNEVKEFIEF